MEEIEIRLHNTIVVLVKHYITIPQSYFFSIDNYPKNNIKLL